MTSPKQRLTLPCTNCGAAACSLVLPEIPETVRSMATTLANVAKIQSRFSKSSPAADGYTLPANPLELLSENPETVAGVLQLRCSSC